MPTSDTMEQGLDEKSSTMDTGITSSPSEVVTAEYVSFPDGGTKAWMTVLGGFLAFVGSIGYVSSFAVFQTYYATATLATHSQDQISWIGSIQVWGCFFFGILSGRISDVYGPQLPIAVGGLILVFGTMMNSISTTYTQILLSQGICSAIGLGLLFTPSLSVQSQWFAKRRGLVVGLVMSGQNVGGVIWPVMADSLLNSRGVSLGWTLRIIGFVQLVLFAVSCLLVQRRFATHDMGALTVGIKRYVKDRRIAVFTLSNLFYFLGLYVPYFYISLYALQYGMSYHLAFYLPAILNGAACIGCYVCGVLADQYFGYFNTITGVSGLSAVIAFAWMATNNNAGIIVWTAAYGFATGGIQTLFSPCIAQLTPEPELIGTWNGINMFVLSFPTLVTGFTGGKLLERTGGTDYVPMQAFTGSTLMVASILYLVTRLLLSGRLRL